MEKGQITERFSAFVNPHTPIPFEIEKLTGISDDMVLNEPDIHSPMVIFQGYIQRLCHRIQLKAVQIGQEDAGQGHGVHYGKGTGEALALAVFWIKQSFTAWKDTW